MSQSYINIDLRTRFCNHPFNVSRGHCINQSISMIASLGMGTGMMIVFEARPQFITDHFFLYTSISIVDWGDDEKNGATWSTRWVIWQCYFSDDVRAKLKRKRLKVRLDLSEKAESETGLEEKAESETGPCKKADNETGPCRKRHCLQLFWQLCNSTIVESILKRNGTGIYSSAYFANFYHLHTLRMSDRMSGVIAEIFCKVCQLATF